MLDSTISVSVWKRFVREGVLDSSRLSKRITESWYRCQRADVNPHLGEGRHILTGEAFIRQKQQNAVLLDMAMPYLEKLNRHIQGSRSIVLLIDSQGCVLVIKGDERTLHKAKEINFVEGVKWTEDQVGTNAIGTALCINEPITVRGAEHYSVASHGWTCSASPIYDEEGILMGVINVSSPADHYHPHTLGAVVSTAYAIEHQWRMRQQNDRLELIQRGFDLLQTNQPVAICNGKKQIICVSHCLRLAVPEWSKMKIAELTEYGYKERVSTPLYSEQHGGLIGYCVRLEAPAPKADSKKSFITSIIFPGEAGISDVFQRTLREIEMVARTDTNVHIYGESGTGKEIIARAIHLNSPRKDGPFIALNCGAIPQQLMESELFGYVEGAFTGARRQGHIGKLEQANHGTLFLDEIGEIPHAMQIALLRVLQEREVIPVGGKKAVSLDIRLITATHRDLRQLVQQGKFREDLFFRLYVFPINVPALRERKEDIPYLVRFYCRQRNWPVEISSEIMEKLKEYRWQGNIRELFNILERMYIMCGGQTPDVSHLPPLLPAETDLQLDGKPTETDGLATLKPLTFREQLEKEEIIQALRKTAGNAALAARMLNIPRSTFYRKLQKFNL